MITLRSFVDLAMEISEPASPFDTALLETAFITNNYAKQSAFLDLGLKMAVATHHEQELRKVRLRSACSWLFGTPDIYKGCF